MTRPLRVLVVCTHNRTRSVLAGALLSRHLKRSGVDAEVLSAGTEAAGHPPTDRTIRMLSDHGLDVSGHRSRTLGNEIVAGADLVVTAEPAHVVRIAGQWPDALARTFTLPELVRFGEQVGPRAGRPLAGWLADVGALRPPSVSYLEDGSVPGIDDPTGGMPQVWETSFAEIDELTRRLATVLM